MLEIFSKHGHPLSFLFQSETGQLFKGFGSWFLIGYRNNSVTNEILPGSVSWECHSRIPSLLDNVILKSFVQGFIWVCQHESISIRNQGWKCDLKMNFCGVMCESCHYLKSQNYLGIFERIFWLFLKTKLFKVSIFDHF